MPMTVLAPQTR